MVSMEKGGGGGILAMNNVILTKWCIALSVNIVFVAGIYFGSSLHM